MQSNVFDRPVKRAPQLHCYGLQVSISQALAVDNADQNPH